MELGRRIYFDKTTGNVILDTGEKQGNVAKTSIEDDIATFTTLSDRNIESFDVIEFTFGEHKQEFTEATSYRVNPTTKELEFNYDPLFDLEDYRQFKKDEMFKRYEEDLLGGFVSSLIDANSVPYEFLYDKDSQMKINGQTNKLNLMLNRLSLGQIKQEDFDTYFPVPWRTANLGVIGLSYEDYLVFADEVENHERSLLTKRMQLEGYIDTLTAKEEIEAVTW